MQALIADVSPNIKRLRAIVEKAGTTGEFSPYAAVGFDRVKTKLENLELDLADESKPLVREDIAADVRKILKEVSEICLTQKGK